MSLLSEDQVFGKYLVRRSLGRGGTGVVYLAEDTLLRREVALKVLDRTLVADGIAERRLVQEAQLVAGLRHPNIVRIHALDRIEETFVIDMEYVAGGALMGSGYRGTGGTYEVMPLIRQVLDALADCHQAGIVHRDVKPSNILIDQRIGALLSDFGLAHLLEQRQHDAMIQTSSSILFVGTPRYAPPESWKDTEPTPAGDIYSVGATIFEAVASRPVHAARSPYELLQKMREGPAPRLDALKSDVSRELADAVAAMLAFDPADRPKDAAETLKMLQDVPEMAVAWNPEDITIEERTPPTGMISIHTPLRPNTHRVRRGIFLVLAAALFVSVAVIFGRSFFLSGLAQSQPVPSPAPGGQVLVASPEVTLYDAVLPERTEVWEDFWAMWRAKTMDTALAFTGTRLWLIQMSGGEEKGALRFEGYWAEYTDPSARIFRYGHVSGTGTESQSSQSIAASLDFVCDQDGSSEKTPIVLERTTLGMTRQSFLEELASEAYLQPLVFSEIGPRQLNWFPALLNTIEVNFVEALVVSPGMIVVDGSSDEASWQAGETLRHDGGGADPWLKVAYTPEQVLLTLHADIVLKDPQIEVSLLDRFRIPMGKSQQLSWRSEHNKPEIGVEWKAQAARNPFEAEVAIAFEENGLLKPLPGAVWRLRVVLRGMGNSGRPVEFIWGNKLDALQGGLALGF